MRQMLGQGWLWFLIPIIFLLSLILLGLATMQTPETESEGFWLLEDIRHERPPAIAVETENSGQSSIEYLVLPRDYRMVWQSTAFRDRKVRYQVSGQIRARFDRLPKEIFPGETMTLVMDLSSEFAIDSQEAMTTPAEFPVVAFVDTFDLSYFVSDLAQSRYQHTIPLYPDSPYQKSKTLEFIMPPGNDVWSAFKIATGLFDAGNYKESRSVYTYRWVNLALEDPNDPSAQSGSLP